MAGRWIVAAFGRRDVSNAIELEYIVSDELDHTCHAWVGETQAL